MIWVVLLYFLLAASLIFNKQMILYGQPIFSQGIRLFIAGNIFLLFDWIYQKKKPYVAHKDLGLFLQVGLFLFCITYSLNIVSMNKFTTAQFSFLLNLSPFLSAILSYFYFSETLNKNKIIALIIGFVGFLPIFLINHTNENSLSLLSFFGFLAIVSMISYTYGLLVVRKIVQLKHYSGTLINGISMLFAGIVTLLISLCVEPWVASPVFNTQFFFSYLSGIIFIGDISVFMLYSWLLKHYTVTFVTFAGFLYPIFGALLGWAFLHESLTWQFFIASVIVFVGLYIFYKQEV